MSSSFEFKEGDRVVLLGDALIEQEQYAGWIEVMLTTAFTDRNVTFRNLGWNADTPGGESRFGLSLLQAGNEPDDEGWKQLVAQLELTKPTVVILGYGMASALEGGKSGLDKFTSDYERLVATIKTISLDARFVFLSPIRRIDNSIHSETTDVYAAAIHQIADDRSWPVRPG